MSGLAAVRARISDAAKSVGRDPADVTLIAVSKEIGVDAIRGALADGVTDLGENRAQELIAKADTLGDLVTRWHFIGRLQRNKVRALARHVALWQSVDRPELVHAIADAAPGRGPKIADPIRTIVEPSRMASSKSLLMPIEHTLSRNSSVSARRLEKCGRGSSAAGGTVISPWTESPAERASATS